MVDNNCYTQRTTPTAEITRHTKIHTQCYSIKDSVMQIEKVQINDRLRVSQVSWKFGFPIIYNFAVIDPWNFLFSLKVAYFLIV